MAQLEHLTPEQIAQYGVVAAPDRLTGKAQDNKAIFDRLVRELVATAVNNIIDKTNELLTAEDVREENESERITAENLRVEAENLRVQAENIRIENEQSRVQAEAARVAAELLRVQAENLRASAENARKTAETAREEAEARRESTTNGIVVRATEQAEAAERSATNAHRAEQSASGFAMGATESANEARQSSIRAEEAGNSAKDFAGIAQASANAAAEAVKHYPRINPATMTWLVWDAAQGEFVDTGVIAEGRNGIEADGLWGVYVDEEGFLVVTYSGDDPPPLSISDDGYLVYTLNGQEIRVGKTVGPEGPAGLGVPEATPEDADKIPIVAPDGTYKLGYQSGAIDDTKASPTNPWSGAKTAEEIGKVQEQVDFILGKNAPSTFDEIRFAVEQGRVGQYFSVGDQLKTNWSDGDTIYDDPFDIAQMGKVYELENGSTILGMMIQQHYANTKSCPFDAQEALYDADEELPAGTYHFTVAGDTWLQSENGKVLQFTITQPIPAGGQLVYTNENGFNQVLAGQSVSTFASPTSFEAIETVVLSEGSDGTDLGVTDGVGNLNHHQRAFRGSNRWKTSMLRQYLNSDKPKGEWWIKQDKWDRASSFINDVPGYIYGFDPDFLAVIKPVKVQTARDTVVSDGGTDITYDAFFPISLEQLNAAPQIAGIEGETLDYWKEIAKNDTTGNLDTSGRFKQFGNYPILATYGLDSKTKARICWLRSAYRGTALNSWFVLSSGKIDYAVASYRSYCAPACVIG